MYTFRICQSSSARFGSGREKGRSSSFWATLGNGRNPMSSPTRAKTPSPLQAAGLRRTAGLARHEMPHNGVGQLMAADTPVKTRPVVCSTCRAGS